MSVKSCKNGKVSQFRENRCTEVDLCLSSTSSEECAGTYTNEISLSLKEEPYQAGDVNIEQSSNVHLGPKTFYENCHFRVFQNLNDSSVISNIPKDSSETENKAFQRSNAGVKYTFKLWIRKDVGQVTIIFGVFILLIIASVLFAMFLNSIFLPMTESETSSSIIETTSINYENISTSSFPTTIDVPRKNKCPVGRILMPIRIDLVSELAAQQRMSYDKRYKITSREEWNASLFEYERIKLEIPEYIIVSHTLQETCLSLKQCVKRVQTLQKFDQTERNLDDIRYNFLIGGNGTIFEGRGWDVVGQHTENYNTRSLGIGFIMDSNKYKSTSSYFYAFDWLLRQALDNNKIKKDYKLIGRCQVVFSTNSPGRNVYLFLRRFYHWIKDPPVF